MIDRSILPPWLRRTEGPRPHAAPGLPARRGFDPATLGGARPTGPKGPKGRPIPLPGKSRGR